MVLAALVWRGSDVPITRLGSPRTRLVVGAAVVGRAIVVVPTFVARMLSGDAGRIELWTAAWSMFTGSPLVGVGPGAWPSLRAFTPISDDNLAVLATSHNSILQVLAESGLIGLIAAIWIVVTVARVGWRAVTGGRDVDDRTVAAVALASRAATGHRGGHRVPSAGHRLARAPLVARLELAARQGPPPRRYSGLGSCSRPPV